VLVAVKRVASNGNHTHTVSYSPLWPLFSHKTRGLLDKVIALQLANYCFQFSAPHHQLDANGRTLMVVGSIGQLAFNALNLCA
jgi:hypothetical protein